MAKVHVLDTDPNGNINCVAHFLMPTGNNNVNVPWKTCYLASFGTVAPTSLLVSSGNNNPAPGKIGTTELTQIQSGDIIEQQFQFGDSPELTTLALKEQRANELADRKINEFKSNFAAKFAFYGHSFGTVA